MARDSLQAPELKRQKAHSTPGGVQDRRALCAGKSCALVESSWVGRGLGHALSAHRRKAGPTSSVSAVFFDCLHQTTFDSRVASLVVLSAGGVVHWMMLQGNAERVTGS